MAGFVNVPSSFFTSAMAVLQDHNLLIFTREGRKIHLVAGVITKVVFSRYKGKKKHENVFLVKTGAIYRQ